MLVVIVVAAALLVVGLVLLVGRAGRRSGGDEPEGLLLRVYAPMLRWSLRHRLVVLLLALVAFGGGLGLVAFLPVTFFPPSEERLLIADVELPGLHRWRGYHGPRVSGPTGKQGPGLHQREGRCGCRADVGPGGRGGQ